jgi:hypothetical protein
MLGQVASMTPDYAKAKEAAERVFYILDRVPPIDVYSKEGKKPVTKPKSQRINSYMHISLTFNSYMHVSLPFNSYMDMSPKHVLLSCYIFYLGQILREKRLSAKYRITEKT